MEHNLQAAKVLTPLADEALSAICERHPICVCVCTSVHMSALLQPLALVMTPKELALCMATVVRLLF